jgi:hypothetical protein
MPQLPSGYGGTETSTGCASCAPAALAALNYVGALAIVTVLSLTLQELGRLGSVASRGPLAVVASGLLVVGLLRYPATIDDHAAARGWSRQLHDAFEGCALFTCSSRTRLSAAARSSSSPRATAASVPVVACVLSRAAVGAPGLQLTVGHL